mmetsp:Transcript_7597/g.18573  ORF Transcript_7597/g.18573 Transcript_7597/m.18573 type:complete len:234 (-) Transcript_7597:536-1237(-)
MSTSVVRGCPHRRVCQRMYPLRGDRGMTRGSWMRGTDCVKEMIGMICWMPAAELDDMHSGVHECSYLSIRTDIRTSHPSIHSSIHSFTLPDPCLFLSISHLSFNPSNTLRRSLSRTLLFKSSYATPSVVLLLVVLLVLVCGCWWLSSSDSSSLPYMPSSVCCSPQTPSSSPSVSCSSSCSLQASICPSLSRSLLLCRLLLCCSTMPSFFCRCVCGTMAGDKGGKVAILPLMKR